VKDDKRELPNNADAVDGEPTENGGPNGEDANNAQRDAVMLVETEDRNCQARPDAPKPQPRHDAEEIASQSHEPAILPRTK